MSDYGAPRSSWDLLDLLLVTILLAVMGLLVASYISLLFG